MTNTEVLIKARKLVAKRWIQGRSSDGAGGFCSIGAIHAFTTRCGEDGPCSAVAKAAGLSSSTDLGGWNDKPGRTQAQVLAAFDKAIGPRGYWRRFLTWVTTPGEAHGHGHE